MSVAISFKDIVKKYGDTTVIPELNLDIQKGEFFTLLGPSGCGKTTLLRMVAGFNSIEGGALAFNDSIMNDVPPGKRNIGMVFQNYAIFPHLSVSENVAFGLQNRKVAKSEQQRRVSEMLYTVQIDQYRDRMPKNLSGGQQQRVALARAIVINPDVLLMDEPLSNLDAKLRVDMRNAIKSIQREVGITTVYVTHDQEEAMAVSDRIAVMNSGVIQQIGTPRDIYQRPANLFVATFIGRTNVIDAKLEIDESGSAAVRVGRDYSLFMPELGIEAKSGESISIRLSVRPEELVVSKDGRGLAGKVINNVFLGLNTHLIVLLDNGQEVEVIQQSTSAESAEIGQTVRLAILSDTINVYDATGERNLNRGTGQ
ncbi:ABC transporter ATP-binding protein [Paenibacillus sp. PL2-23]|uniref:ABC transporter ATP-binding protein n=1 Tax=Paenibacillus sp. PL2-23 TaxID=2100729 RepID=UPI0030F777E7